MTRETSIPRPRSVTVLRWVFGLGFVFVGVMHFIVPDGLPDPFSWMYEVSDTVHYIAGTAEILGGLGLILPHLTGIMPWLTSLAAAGLAAVMIGALLWHAGRGEWALTIPNALDAAVMTYVARFEWNRRTLHSGTKTSSVRQRATS